MGSEMCIRDSYLLHPCDSDTDAIITNPHTSNALSTTARRTPPTQSARRRELLPPSWTHAPVGIYNNLMRCGTMCGHGYMCTDAIIPVDGHNTHTIQSNMHVMQWQASADNSRSLGCCMTGSISAAISKDFPELILGPSRARPQFFLPCIHGMQLSVQAVECIT